jgi:hypothetical protein
MFNESKKRERGEVLGFSLPHLEPYTNREFLPFSD